jgi:hypothetical protein
VSFSSKNALEKASDWTQSLDPSFSHRSTDVPSVLGWTLPARPYGSQCQFILAWLSRKSIDLPTIRMESFEDSPDAERHGGYSILR